MIPGVYKGAPLKIPADDWRIVQQMVAEYRTRGAIGSNGGFRFATAKAPRPWQIQKAGGRDVFMQRGLVARWKNALAVEPIPTISEVPVAGSPESPVDKVTVANNRTTIFWLEVYLQTNTSDNGITFWELHSDPGTPNDSPLYVNRGTTFPTQTFNPYVFTDAPGPGDPSPEVAYIKLATVIATSGEITSITQHFTGVLPLIFPTGIQSVFQNTPLHGDMIYSNVDGCAAPEKWATLPLGADGSILMVKPETVSGPDSPAWHPPGSNGDILLIEDGVPKWSSASAIFTEIGVVTAVREDGLGALQYKTRTIQVLNPGAESDWITV